MPLQAIETHKSETPCVNAIAEGTSLTNPPLWRQLADRDMTSKEPMPGAAASNKTQDALKIFPAKKRSAVCAELEKTNAHLEGLYTELQGMQQVKAEARTLEDEGMLKNVQAEEQILQVSRYTQECNVRGLISHVRAQVLTCIHNACKQNGNILHTSMLLCVGTATQLMDETVMCKCRGSHCSICVYMACNCDGMRSKCKTCNKTRLRLAAAVHPWLVPALTLVPSASSLSRSDA